MYKHKNRLTLWAAAAMATASFIPQNASAGIQWNASTGWEEFSDGDDATMSCAGGSCYEDAVWWAEATAPNGVSNNRQGHFHGNYWSKLASDDDERIWSVSGSASGVWGSNDVLLRTSNYAGDVLVEADYNKDETFSSNVNFYIYRDYKRQSSKNDRTTWNAHSSTSGRQVMDSAGTATTERGNFTDNENAGCRAADGIDLYDYGFLTDDVMLGFLKPGQANGWDASDPKVGGVTYNWGDQNNCLQYWFRDARDADIYWDTTDNVFYITWAEAYHDRPGDSTLANDTAGQFDEYKIYAGRYTPYNNTAWQGHMVFLEGNEGYGGELNTNSTNGIRNAFNPRITVTHNGDDTDVWVAWVEKCNGSNNGTCNSVRVKRWDDENHAWYQYGGSYDFDHFATGVCLQTIYPSSATNGVAVSGAGNPAFDDTETGVAAGYSRLQMRTNALDIATAWDGDNSVPLVVWSAGYSGVSYQDNVRGAECRIKISQFDYASNAFLASTFVDVGVNTTGNGTIAPRIAAAGKDAYVVYTDKYTAATSDFHGYTYVTHYNAETQLRYNLRRVSSKEKWDYYSGSDRMGMFPSIDVQGDLRCIGFPQCFFQHWGERIAVSTIRINASASPIIQNVDTFTCYYDGGGNVCDEYDTHLDGTVANDGDGTVMTGDYGESIPTDFAATDVTITHYPETFVQRTADKDFTTASSWQHNVYNHRKGDADIVIRRMRAGDY